MEIKTWVWEKTSQKGNKYFYGFDKETKTKVVLFKNNKQGDKQPAFNVIVELDEDWQKSTEDDTAGDLPF